MMTDVEKFIELYKNLGIDLKVETYNNGNKTISLSSDISEKFGGYFSFYSVIEFDEKDKFVCQNFYE